MSTASSFKNLYTIPTKTINGNAGNLSSYQNQLMLIVNVASKCGLTPQYAELEALFKKHHKDITILGFPCNQFGGQEPGESSDILAFCGLNYDVSFPLFEKSDVNGSNRNPVYSYLIEHAPARINKPDSQFAERLASKDLLPEDESDVQWNFEKFLVNGQGDILARFAPDVSVSSETFLDVLSPLLTA